MTTTTKKNAAASGNPAKRAAAKKPQDRKPKATTATTDDGETYQRTVELEHPETGEAFPIDVDLSAVKNVRLMRRMKKNDLEAVIEFYELMFGGVQLDALEDTFGLEDVHDYNAFMERVMGEISPN